MTARRTGVFGADSATRIIYAVGQQPDDMAALADDITKAVRAFNEMATFKRARKRGSRKLLASTIRALNRTSKAIAGDPLLATTAAEMTGIAARLRNFERWHDHADKRHTARHGRQPTPIEWLAGEILPDIFERRFALSATFTRDGNAEPAGALIDFVAATLKETEVDYSRESIARAITRLRE